MMIEPIVADLRSALALPDGFRWDESFTQPTAEQLTGRTGYAWPDRREQQMEEADGRWEEARLRVMVAVIAASRGETRAVAPDRATSQLLDRAQHDLDASVAAHRKHPRWWDLYVLDRRYDLVATHEVRGFLYVVVARLNDPQPDDAGSGS